LERLSLPLYHTPAESVHFAALASSSNTNKELPQFFWEGKGNGILQMQKFWEEFSTHEELHKCIKKGLP
jgi:hypothetical protein